MDNISICIPYYYIIVVVFVINVILLSPIGLETYRAMLANRAIIVKCEYCENKVKKVDRYGCCAKCVKKLYGNKKATQ